MTFYQRLVGETVGGQMALASTPQIQDGLAGRISRETYIAYLTEAYHHVKHAVPVMREARARTSRPAAATPRPRGPARRGRRPWR